MSKWGGVCGVGLEWPVRALPVNLWLPVYVCACVCMCVGAGGCLCVCLGCTSLCLCFVLDITLSK